MPLCIFAKLFPSHITTDGKPTGPCLYETRLTTHNRSNIPQFGVVDTAIKWTPKGHQCSKCLQTRWYVADSPGPAILGLPSLLRPDVTLLFHSTPVKISSRPILAGLKVLVNSLELNTSLSEMMPNLWYMHPESVQSLCNPWYMRNMMSSWTKVLLFQLKSLLIRSLHLPTRGRQMGNYESV